MSALTVLSAEEVRRLLDPTELVERLGAGFAALSAGTVSMPSRIGVQVPDRGVTLLMGAHRHGAGTITCKVVSSFPGLPAELGSTHSALLVVCDAETGAPVLIADGEPVTALRTAAVSRLATRRLARPDASVLTILGSGVQARAHLAALTADRDYAEVRVWARRPEAAEELAGRHDATFVADLGAALDGADVICACTAATEPVVRREHLAPGAHINSVGFTAEGREVDPATVRAAAVAVESRGAALAPPPAGCLDLEGLTDAVELGELISGRRAGRSSPSEITLFKSVGVALADDIAGELLVEALRPGQ